MGVLYCRGGQSSEEEMYNNESAEPPFQEFLALLGTRVRLRGFRHYRAQLDTKSEGGGGVLKVRGGWKVGGGGCKF